MVHTKEAVLMLDTPSESGRVMRTWQYNSSQSDC